MSSPETRAKILVAEDEGIVAKDIENTLKKLGYNVVACVQSGEEAIKCAKEKKPDLALLDIRLNGRIDGISAAEEIRKQKIPVIYLTAYSDEETLKRAKITSPSGYILKPFEERELYINIENTLYNHEIEREAGRLRQLSETLLENVPAGITIVNREKRVAEINKLQEKIFSADRKNALNKEFLAEYLPSLSEDLYDSTEKALKENKTCYVLGVEYTNTETGKYSLLDFFVTPIMEAKKNCGAIIIATDVTKEKELAERIRILEKKEVDLNQKDKFALYGITRYPGLSDLEISNKIGINRSTFTGIRNKLEREKYFKTVRMPNFSALGYEVITVRYGKVPAMDQEVIIAAAEEIIGDAPYIYSICTESEFMYIEANESFTGYRQKEDLIAKKHPGIADALREYETIHFPTALSKIMVPCECSGFIKNFFNLSVQDKEEQEEGSINEKRVLSENEVKVLYGLVKYPDISDNDLAEKLSLSNITVSQIKKRLFDEKLLQTIALPGFQKIGCELIVLMRGQYEHSADEKTRAKTVSGELPPPFIFLESLKDAVGVYAFKDYNEYRKVFDRFMKIQREKSLFLQDPHITVFPMRKILIDKLFDFAPLLAQKHMLEDF